MALGFMILSEAGLGDIVLIGIIDLLNCGLDHPIWFSSFQEFYHTDCNVMSRAEGWSALQMACFNAFERQTLESYLSITTYHKTDEEFQNGSRVEEIVCGNPA